MTRNTATSVRSEANILTKTSTKTEPELEPLNTIVGVTQLCQAAVHWKDDLRLTYRRRARTARPWPLRKESPPPDRVAEVGHPLRRIRADRLQSHAARVH